ncbi:hypothetical protein [Sinorhizobium meliloti]|uniref:hypothetical protein n=1 Tax=Rhizobium meliloti TaxID=382 RepID=UPI00028614F4|nr:hypothetical protein [Sinorhizobium meliloti]WQP14295.1 hypothetical protein U8C30_17685 [Sinorhizobium meliloti]WQP27774.1 hypothetical protein U8C43_17645 [Sinorhizobium meliloti]CCM66135.1 hypothetical protein BN406_00090 [Sinorhizobium meliloti Rm41]
MRQAQKETVGLAKGGKPYQSTGLAKNPVAPATLAEAGIDKNLAKRGTKLGALPARRREFAPTETRLQYELDGTHGGPVHATGNAVQTHDEGAFELRCASV